MLFRSHRPLRRPLSPPCRPSAAPSSAPAALPAAPSFVPAVTVEPWDHQDLRPYSEANETSGNLLRFNLPIIPPSRSPLRPTPHTAYTLWDCGGSHKFVHPNLITTLRTSGNIIKIRNCGSMDLTTAGRHERMPLREARLSLDIGGYKYSGWFVLYPLAKYDIILGKSWMEEVPHHVDLNRNILSGWLGQDSPGSKFRYRLVGLPRDRVCQGHQIPPSTKCHQLPEITEFMVAEITNKATYQQDCAYI